MPFALPYVSFGNASSKGDNEMKILIGSILL